MAVKTEMKWMSNSLMSVYRLPSAGLNLIIIFHTSSCSATLRRSREGETLCHESCVMCLACFSLIASQLSSQFISSQLSWVELSWVVWWLSGWVGRWRCPRRYCTVISTTQNTRYIAVCRALVTAVFPATRSIYVLEPTACLLCSINLQSKGVIRLPFNRFPFFWIGHRLVNQPNCFHFSETCHLLLLL